MDLNLGAADEGFRQEVRAFLAEHWPRAKGSAVAGPEAAAFRTLATERGYLYRAVPKAYGGSEQAPDPVRGRIIREEFAVGRDRGREAAGLRVPHRPPHPNPN